MKSTLATHTIVLVLILTLTLSAVSITDGADANARPGSAHIERTNDGIGPVALNNTDDEIFAVSLGSGG